MITSKSLIHFNHSSLIHFYISSMHICKSLRWSCRCVSPLTCMSDAQDLSAITITIILRTAKLPFSPYNHVKKPLLLFHRVLSSHLCSNTDTLCVLNHFGTQWWLIARVGVRRVSACDTRSVARWVACNFIWHFIKDISCSYSPQNAPETGGDIWEVTHVSTVSIVTESVVVTEDFLISISLIWHRRAMHFILGHI